MHEEIIVQLTVIIAVGIAAQWLAWAFGLPSILLLLIGGIAVGPLTGLIHPDSVFGNLLFPIVSISVALILYEGGLSLRVSDLRRAGGTVYSLITVGALVTWAGTGFAAWGILHMDPRVAALLGAVLVVTGPTVILPLLRQIRPKGPIGAILKWEGIVIDPLGAMLTVLVFEAILSGQLEDAPAKAGMAVLRTVTAGPVIGGAAAGILVLMFRRFLIPHYLDNPVSLTLVVAAYTISNAIQPESGLLATTVMGLILANQRVVDVEHIIEFKENLRVLLITGLFVVLGARVKLEYLRDAGAPVVLFILLLIVAVRPVSVFLSTVFARLNVKEKVFLASMAPRGIVAAAISSILALRLEENGFADAESLVSTTFLVIIVTVAVYGLAASPLARFLGIADPNPRGALIVGAHPAARRIGQVLQEKGCKVLLVDTNRHDIKEARLGGLPAYSGSVLSEHALDEMNLTGIGTLLAMAPSDWVNILAVQRFSRLFGKSKVYQLPPERGTAREKAGHRHLYGRRLFGPDMTYWALQDKMDAGFVVKATPLTDEFGFEAFEEYYGSSAIPLFRIKAGGDLRPVAVDATPTFEPGETLVSLVREPEEPPPTPPW